MAAALQVLAFNCTRDNGGDLVNDILTRECREENKKVNEEKPGERLESDFQNLCGVLGNTNSANGG